MKVSKDLIKEIIIPAVKVNCIKTDDTTFAPVEKAVYNVFKYINYINVNLKPDQTILDNMVISDIVLPSGLAQFLEPRRVQFDVTNRLQANLIDQASCNEDELPGKDYTYYDFQRDLTKIKVAMRASDIEWNTSVAQAVKDVDVLQVVDNLEINGHVKWNGAIGSEFIPIKLVDGFNIGLNSYEYDIETKLMLNSLFNTSIKSMIVK